MRRQVIIGASAGAAAILVIGLLVGANQAGVFGPSGRAKHLLARAQHAQSNGNLQAAQAALEELIGTFPQSPWTDDALLQLGQLYETQQQPQEARAMYRLLLARFPSSPVIPDAQLRLGNINVALLFSPLVTELDAVYEVKPGDTLSQIASAHQTTVEFLQRANSIEGALIHPRQKLKVPTGRFSIVVDKSQNQLLLTESEQFIKSYAVATGSENSTPVGTFTVVNRIIDPVWYRQGAAVPPDSPENILGTRWLGFDKAGYGIHGTTDPGSIGQQVTAGCVRMTNADVEELFAIIPVGTEVTIVD